MLSLSSNENEILGLDPLIWIVIAVGVIIVSIIVLIIIVAVCNKKKEKKVKEISTYYATIAEINSKTNFEYVDNTYQKYAIKVNSKRQFDNFNYSKKCIEYISSNLNNFIQIVDAIEKNKKTYSEYMYAINNTPHTKDEKLARDNKLSLKTISKIETKLAKKLIERPTLDYVIQVEASYSSAKGQSNYRWSKNFAYDFIKDNVDELKEKKTNNRLNTSRHKDERNNQPRKEKTITSIDDLEVID